MQIPRLAVSEPFFRCTCLLCQQCSSSERKARSTEGLNRPLSPTRRFFHEQKAQDFQNQPLQPSPCQEYFPAPLSLTLQQEETKACPQENTLVQFRRTWTSRGRITRRLWKYRITWLTVRSALSCIFKRRTDLFLFHDADYIDSQTPRGCLKFQLLHKLVISNLSSFVEC